MPPSPDPSGRSVLVVGATGLVGAETVRQLAADDSVARVVVAARRIPAGLPARVESHVVDFDRLHEHEALFAVDQIFCALGTTIKQAGSQAAFRKVDFEYALNIARLGLKHGARHFLLVSALGANPESSIFYNRVKGELEDALAQLPLEALVIARPSLLVGDRTVLGQPERRGERIGLAVSNLLGFLIPENLKPITASSVARALLSRVPLAKGRELLLSGAMQPART